VLHTRRAVGHEIKVQAKAAHVAGVIHHSMAESPLEAKMSSIPALAPRDRYTAPERCTYLNQASLGLIPVPAIDAMESFLKSSGLSRPQFGQVNIGASLRPGSLWALPIVANGRGLPRMPGTRTSSGQVPRSDAAIGPNQVAIPRIGRRRARRGERADVSEQAGEALEPLADDAPVGIGLAKLAIEPPTGGL
jgi:hypothetical protein